VDALSHDEADDEVALGDLQRNLVPARRGLPEDLGGLLDPVAVGGDPRQLRIVDDDVLGDELVEDAPVARVVAVDRLDVATDQRLVFLSGRTAPSSSSEWQRV
jgi:hypothetical protein